MPQTALQKATEILDSCNFSTLTTSCTETPFFTPTYDSVTIKDVINKPSKDNTKILDISHDVELPDILLNMFLLLDSNKREFSYNIFSFMPIDEIDRRYRMFQKKEQSSICDLATSYYGMGHIIVLSWNKKTKTFMLRRDGGSNDYDRIDNMNFITNYNAAAVPQESQITEERLFKTLEANSVEELRDLFINK
jgi:hypothetical protein|tara:strand:- start:53 stop:631 length:579 start_codon:yes stop_codon:yes gene_type:complete